MAALVETFALVEEIETRKIMGGFTRDQVLAPTDKVISAVQDDIAAMMKGE